MDFEKIIKNTTDDKDFIIEITYDLLQEAKQCYDDLILNLKINNFNQFIMFAHKIKGSALYLNCNELVKCGKNLEQLGKNVLKINIVNGVNKISEINEIKKDIEHWLDKYDDALHQIKKDLLLFEKNYKK
jgi:HPt (histidine-containing phosphotransfer) domain-containing protein